MAAKISSAREEVATPLRLPEELLAKSGFLMVRLGMAYKARAIAQLEHAGFSQYHYSLLALLGEQSRNTQASIADALAVDRSQLVGVLDELEGRGLVERQRDPNDRRRHVVSLTAKGRRQLVRLRAMIDELEDEMFAPLDTESRRTLHTILLRLAGYHDPVCTAGP
jgi:MarR family transcriptional regulator, lower aerobic nicotinate degradation pathway regulator